VQPTAPWTAPDPAQIIKLLEACSKRNRPLILLFLATGMRLSEVLGLRWDEVDLARGVIRLPGERTKNGCSRTVPLNEHARKVLQDAALKRLEKCPLVFHVHGRPIKSIRDGFDAACTRTGLKDFHVHDLRHCFASALAMCGVPLQAIGELLGHKTMSMTQRYYAHLSPDMLKRP